MGVTSTKSSSEFEENPDEKYYKTLYFNAMKVVSPYNFCHRYFLSLRCAHEGIFFEQNETIFGLQRDIREVRKNIVCFGKEM